MDRAKQREIASKGGMASHRRRKEMMEPGGSSEPSMSETSDSMERSGGDDTNEQIR